MMAKRSEADCTPVKFAGSCWPVPRRTIRPRSPADCAVAAALASKAACRPGGALSRVWQCDAGSSLLARLHTHISKMSAWVHEALLSFLTCMCQQRISQVENGHRYELQSSGQAYKSVTGFRRHAVKVLTASLVKLTYWGKRANKPCFISIHTSAPVELLGSAGAVRNQVGHGAHKGTLGQSCSHLLRGPVAPPERVVVHQRPGAGCGGCCGAQQCRWGRLCLQLIWQSRLGAWQAQGHSSRADVH